MAWYKPLFKNRRPETEKAFDEISPAEPLAVIGDIHGRLDLLDHHLKSKGTGKLICVGDYVDRGPDAAGVLQRLFDLYTEKGVICLLGNHEEMLLSFIDAPNGPAKRWLSHGGVETLQSFKATTPSKRLIGDGLQDASDNLSKAMGADLLNWLRGLPRYFVSGNVAIVHAGADPEKPLDQQDASTLTWGHRNFMMTTRSDGVWVVHGHTIVKEPKIDCGRISIDTGGYRTGRLTMARISHAIVEFETT